MNMQKIALGLLIGAVVLAVSGVAMGRAMPVPLHQPQLETITFVDYWVPSHAGPGPHPVECSGNFKFTRGGLKWLVSSVTYDINESTIPSGLSGAATAIGDAFDVWTSAESASPTFSEGASSNTISWQALGTGGIVAYASISYYPATKEIVAFQMVFNSDLDWSTSGESGKFDVQNVAAHEAGHVEGLGHVNAPKDGLETMYKLTTTGETIKQTLCDGDIAGVSQLY
jgi:hypothetical protein